MNEWSGRGYEHIKYKKECICNWHLTKDEWKGKKGDRVCACFYYIDLQFAKFKRSYGLLVERKVCTLEKSSMCSFDQRLFTSLK